MEDLISRQIKEQQESRAAALFEEGVKHFNEQKAESLFKAATEFERAAEILRKTGEKDGLNKSYLYLGRIHSFLGEFQKSLEYFNQILSSTRNTNDKTGEVFILNEIACVYITLGEKRIALEYLDTAEKIVKESGSDFDHISVLNSLGRIYDDFGEKQKALDYYNEALRLAEQNDDQLFTGTILANIGGIYYDRGEKREMLNYLNPALKIFRDNKYKGYEASTLKNIGSAYLDLGEHSKALENFNQALQIFREIGDKHMEAVIVKDFGMTAYALGNIKNAVEYFEQSLKLLRLIGDKFQESTVLTGLSLFYSKLGENEKALVFAQQGLKMLQKYVGNPIEISIALNTTGMIYYGLKNYETALVYYARSLALSKAFAYSEGENFTLSNIMFALFELDKSKTANFFGKLCINKMQELRFHIKGFDVEEQKAFLRRVDGAYRFLVDSLMRDERLVEALQVLNLYRDQEFFDFADDIEKPVEYLSFTEWEDSFASQYYYAVEPLVDIARRLEQAKRESSNEQSFTQENQEIMLLEKQFKNALDEFIAILLQTDEATGEAASGFFSNLEDLTEIQTALFGISQTTKHNAAAIYTFAGVKFFRLLYITSERIKAFTADIKAEELNEKTARFYQLLQSPNYDPRPLAKELYDIIFQPLEDDLEQDEIQNLMWSLEGTLRHIPIAALYDGEKYMVEKYRTSVFTRFDKTQMMRTGEAVREGVGFGSSLSHEIDLPEGKFRFDALPGVRKELETVFSMQRESGGTLKGEVYVNENFNKANFFASLTQNHPVVHIASHFHFQPGDENHSFLLLGDGSFLTLKELKAHKDIFRNIKILVLSACNTAAVRSDITGREIDGFAELAQRLGAQSVIATLWSVADNALPLLMLDFYSRQQDEKITKSEALRQAQNYLLQGNLPEKFGQITNKNLPLDPIGSEFDKAPNRETKSAEQQNNLFEISDEKPFSHPYYWSPVVLFGNGI